MLLPDIMSMLARARVAEPHEAIGLYLAAIEALSVRARALPTSDEICELRAEAHVSFALVLARRVDGSPAAQLDAAIAIAPEIAAGDPRHGLVEWIAMAHTKRAVLRVDLDMTAAFLDLTRAIDLLEDLPRSERCSRVLGEASTARARICSYSGDPRGARLDATSAIASFESLRAVGIDDRAGRSDAFLARAEVHAAAKSAAAAADYEAAVAVFDAPPTSVAERSAFARALLGLGHWLHSTTDLSGALASFEQASETTNGREDDELLNIEARISIAIIHAALGSLPAAATELDRVFDRLVKQLFSVRYVEVALLFADRSLAIGLHLRSEHVVQQSLTRVRSVMNAVARLGGASKLPPRVQVDLARMLDRFLSLPLNDETRQAFVAYRASVTD